MPRLQMRNAVAATAAAWLAAEPASAADGRCADNSAPVYFAPRSAEITATADRVLQVLMRRAAPCRIDGVTVLGRGDAHGPGRDDTELPLKRAQAVAGQLAGAGVPRDEIRLLAKPAEAQTRRLLERRATVHMHLSPERPQAQRTP